MKPRVNKPFLRHFASRLRALRQERAISQVQLGKEVNVGTRTIFLYEQGEMAPSIEVVARLARFFDTTTDDLIFNAKGKIDEIRDRELLECLHQADQLPRRERTLIKDLVELLVSKRGEKEKAASA